MALETFDLLRLQLPEAPEDFVAVEQAPAQMDLASLWRRVQRLKQAGHSAAEQETTLWSYILYPFLGCSLLLAGLPLALARERGGLALGFGVGLLLGFGAWVGWSFSLTLGKTGAIPAILSTSMVHLGLLTVGFLLLRRLRF